jgi:hypothetical protein
MFSSPCHLCLTVSQINILHSICMLCSPLHVISVLQFLRSTFCIQYTCYVLLSESSLSHRFSDQYFAFNMHAKFSSPSHFCLTGYQINILYSICMLCSPLQVISVLQVLRSIFCIQYACYVLLSYHYSFSIILKMLCKVYNLHSLLLKCSLQSPEPLSLIYLNTVTYTLGAS